MISTLFENEGLFQRRSDVIFARVKLCFTWTLWQSTRLVVHPMLVVRAIVERCVYKTMQVAVAVAESAQEAICFRYSYNSRTTFQLIEIVARVSRR